jgi:predicted ester cyclase
MAMSPNAISTAQNTEQHRAIALRFAQEGWGTNPGWESIWDEVIAPDVVQHFNSSAEPIVGLAANKAFNASLFQGFPDIQQTIEDVIAEDDKVVYRTTIQGTHTGIFLGIPPTGKSARVNDFTLLRFANHQIVEWWYECNLLEVMKQLGLISE